MENRELSEVPTDSTQTYEEPSRSIEHDVQFTETNTMTANLYKLDMKVLAVVEKISAVELRLSELDDAEGHEITGTEDAETRLQKLMLKAEERLIRLQERYSRIKGRVYILEGHTNIHERLSRAKTRYLALKERISRAENRVSQLEDQSDQEDTDLQPEKQAEQQPRPSNDTTLNRPAKVGKSSGSSRRIK